MKKCQDCGATLDDPDDPAVQGCAAQRGFDHRNVIELPKRVHPAIRGLWANLSDSAWGDATSMLFAIAELLWALDEEIPETWGFRASPMQERGRGAEAVIVDDGWPDVQLAEEFLAGGFTPDDLRAAGNIFNRYASLLKAAGKDY